MAKKGSATSRHASKKQESTSGGDVATLVPHDSALHRKDGKLILTINRRDLPEESYDLTGFDLLGELAPEMASAFSRVMASASTVHSRKVRYQDLTHGYLQFLAAIPDPPTAYAGISADHFTKFVEWLNTFISSKSNEPLSSGTKAHRLGVIKNVIIELARFHKQLKPSELFHNRTFQKDSNVASTDGKKERRVTHEDFLKLKIHLIGEIQRILREAETALTANTYGPNSSRKPFAIDAMVAREILNEFEYFPERNAISNSGTSPFILENIRAIGIRSISPFVGPTIYDVTVIAYFIAMHTGFNEQVLRDLQIDRVDFDQFGDTWHMSLSGYKSRSRTVQRYHSSFDATDVSPARCIHLITRWTSLLRNRAPERLRNDLFLYLPRNRKKEDWIRSLASSGDIRSSDFERSQALLCKEAGVPFIGFRALRSHVSDLAHEATGGDERMVSALLGNTVAVTNANYRSDESRSLDELRLASAMQARGRYLGSGGVVDPRDHSSTEQTTAATPGYVCIDAMDSPIPGQVRGSPCTAYPMCPSCPLAQPSSDKPYLLARVWQLQAQLERARTAIGNPRLRARFGAVVAALQETRLRLEAEGYSAKASAMYLNPLPEIE